jgi:hypothetical protein
VAGPQHLQVDCIYPGSVDASTQVVSMNETGCIISVREPNCTYMARLLLPSEDVAGPPTPHFASYHLRYLQFPTNLVYLVQVAL